MTHFTAFLRFERQGGRGAGEQAADADELGPDHLPPEVESAALFFVSEGLANVLRHARASTVILRITAVAGALTVEVSRTGGETTLSQIQRLVEDPLQLRRSAMKSP